MSQLKQILITILTISAIMITAVPVITASADNTNANISLSPLAKNKDDADARYVFDVVIHKPEEMAKLLDRIEQLSNNTTLNSKDPRLALVLHGPEIAFFTQNNYKKYMNLVDRAAALDKKGIIDVKVCDTMIRALNIDDSELPDFVEHVPYGPTEVERLVSQGFIKM